MPSIPASGSDAPDPEAPATVAEALRPLLLRLSRRLRTEAQRFGASASDAQLLGAIWKRPGVTAAALAAAEGVSRPSMGAHVQRLERAGWIARERAPEGGDRRSRALKLTPAGLKVLGDIRRGRTDWLATRLAALPGPERHALAAALPALAALMEAQA